MAWSNPSFGPNQPSRPTEVVKMLHDNQNQIRIGAEPLQRGVGCDDLPFPLEKSSIALWRPSLAALLLSGICSGGILGAADGVAFHYIVGGFATAFEAGLCGAGLGIVGGALFVMVRRAFWGPDISVDVGTVLGLLYGIAPGLAVLYQCFPQVFAIRSLAGVVMACSMGGLVVGGLLDRITDAIVARTKRLQGRE
jgi:hypothetical protein